MLPPDMKVDGWQLTVDGQERALRFYPLRVALRAGPQDASLA
jgi:hypothetical protein